MDFSFSVRLRDQKTRVGRHRLPLADLYNLSVCVEPPSRRIEKGNDIVWIDHGIDVFVNRIVS